MTKYLAGDGSESLPTVVRELVRGRSIGPPLGSELIYEMYAWPIIVL